jgi:hypothetical protein
MKTMKKQNKKGKGWSEDKDPSCIVKGKAVARKHHEVAIKDSLKETERVAMVAPEPKKKEIEAIEETEVNAEDTEDDVPLLPAVSNELAENAKFIKFNFAVPSSKTSWLKRFAEKNHLEITVDGTCGHAELLEPYFFDFFKAISGFEDEFEEEMQKERDNRDPEEDSPSK